MRYAVVLLCALLLVSCEGSAASGGRVLQFVGEPRVTTGLSNTIVVEGRVRNTHPSRAYTGNIGVTLFDAEGKIVGTAIDTVQGLPPGDEITYRANGVNAPPTWAKVEQKITLEMAG